MNREDLFALTQSIISIVVVLGGGLTLIFSPENKDAVVPVITLVLGFYFSSASSARGFAQGQASVGKSS